MRSGLNLKNFLHTSVFKKYFSFNLRLRNSVSENFSLSNKLAKTVWISARWCMYTFQWYNNTVFNNWRLVVPERSSCVFPHCVSQQPKSQFFAYSTSFSSIIIADREKSKEIILTLVSKVNLIWMVHLS